MPSSSNSQKARWLWYGLHGLVLVACGLGMMRLTQRAVSQRAAVEGIEDLGGSIMYDFELQNMAHPPGPQWLRVCIGDDYFMRVTTVMLWDPETTDEDLEILRSLHQVKRVYLDGTQVTDAGLVHLQHFTDLEYLSLRETPVTEEAKERLRKRLPSCWIR